MSQVKDILILGGYGRTGIEIAKLLLKHSNCTVWLAGRDPIKAARTARELNSRCFEERVKGVEVNAALKTQLVRLFEKADMVISTLPLTGEGKKIAQAALEAGINYMDLNAVCAELDKLYQLDDKVREAGLTFITRAGFAAGTPTAMARHIAGQFDSTDRVTIDEIKDAGPVKVLPSWFPCWKEGKQKGSSEISSVSVTGTGISAGRSKKITLTVGHSDASLAAAIAAFPCALDLIKGFISRPGIHHMGEILDYDMYLEKLWDMGMTVSLKTFKEREQMGSRSGEIPLWRSGKLRFFKETG